jgi:hypothetical protein
MFSCALLEMLSPAMIAERVADAERERTANTLFSLV